MVRAFTRRKPTSVGTEDSAKENKENVKEVLGLLQKKMPLTKKQFQYCNEQHVARILRSRGNNVNKAARQLRGTLAWRENLDVDHLTADEFSPELAFGTAYVAGRDDEHRPVVIVRLKPEHHASQSQKRFFQFIVFTIEVAIATMPFNGEQCVIILDAGYLKKGSQGLTTVVQILKMLAEHYPDRLARAFIVDAPPILYYLWKGIGCLNDLGLKEKMRFVFSKNYIAPASPATAERNLAMREGKSYANGNLWSEHSDKEGSTLSVIDSISQSKGAALVADKQQARSFSFASSATASCWIHEPTTTEFRSFRIDAVPVRGHEGKTASSAWGNFSAPRDLRREEVVNQAGCKQRDRSIDVFRQYLGLYASSYNEAAYRAIMKPPLGGLVAIVSPELKKHHFSSGIAAMEALRILEVLK